MQCNVAAIRWQKILVIWTTGKNRKNIFNSFLNKILPKGTCRVREITRLQLHALLGKCEVNKINTKFYVNRKHWLCPPLGWGPVCPPFNINSCILCLCFIWCHDVYSPLSGFCCSPHWSDYNSQSAVDFLSDLRVKCFEQWVCANISVASNNSRSSSSSGLRIQILSSSLGFWLWVMSLFNIFN